MHVYFVLRVIVCLESACVLCVVCNCLSLELLHVCAVLFVVCVPKGMPEMSDILFLSGISGL